MVTTWKDWTMVRPQPEEVLQRVAGMVVSAWPTTEDERRAWFASFGMPTDGQLVTENSELNSRSRQYFALRSADWPQTGWHTHRDRFVGVSWFLWAHEDDNATRTAAERLRALFGERWPTVEESPGPAGGFTAFWAPGTSQVDLYYHAPRDDPRPGLAPSVVQLHVDHRARVGEEELDAVIGSVLKEHWDPIGLYAEPLERRLPPGEYDSYAGWIADRLLVGDGRPEILAELHRARERMGLADSQVGDAAAADRILDSWREHRQRYPQVSGR